jgi:hypothetical protein
VAALEGRRIQLHVAQTLKGMGYADLAAEFGVAGVDREPARPRQTAIIEVGGEHPRVYLT